MTIARYFVADGEKYHPGIPASDLDEETFNALPEHLQRTVDESPLYRKTKPKDETQHAAPAAPVTAPAAKDEK